MPLPPINRPARAQLGALFDEGARSIARALPICVGDPAASVRTFGFEATTFDTLERRLLGESGRLVLVAFSVTGAFGGAVFLWLREAEVSILLESMITDVQVRGLDEQVASVCSEVGNILVSSFLNAAADRLRTFCVPSVPHLILGEPATCLPRMVEGGLLPRDVPTGRPVWHTRLLLERGLPRCELRVVVLPDLDFDADLARLS